MAQAFWRYTATSGDCYDISIYHGDTSGHVVIYCGNEIIHIDFSVFSDHNYSFMAGDDLLQLSVSYKDSAAGYELRKTEGSKLIPDHASGPEVSGHKAISIVIVAAVIIVVLVILFWYGRSVHPGN